MLIKVNNPAWYQMLIDHYQKQGHPPYVARTLAFFDVGRAC